MSIEPSSGYGPLLVHLEAAIVSGMSEPVSCTWEFGDGTTAAGLVVNHEFTGTGLVSVRLIATDSLGQQSVAEGAIRLLNRIPHAQFTVQPNPAPTHHPIRFDASESYDSDGEIVSYHWLFGDGGTADGITVEHVFQTPGIEYRIVLTVTDNDGGTNEMYRIIELIGCDH
jgi:PKD repeat protein